MSSEKTEAIIVRVVEFSESSCVLTLFTRDFGKVAALAKGARRPKGPFESAIDLLAICRIVFLRKSSDALDLLTEAKLERRFRAAARDLSRLYSGYYVAELLNSLTDLRDPHPQLYDVARQTLVDLDGQSDPWATLLRFEVLTLRLLGHFPSLADCAGCGAPIPKTQRLTFGFLAGGVLCTTCRPGHRKVVSVARPVVELLQEFASSTPPTGDLPGDRAFRGEVRAVMSNFIANLIGRRPRMHSYLDTGTASEGKRAGVTTAN